MGTVPRPRVGSGVVPAGAGRTGARGPGAESRAGPVRPETLAADPWVLGGLVGGKEALALDLEPRMEAKPEGQGRCPAHLYKLPGWAGRAWGMGSLLPVLLGSRPEGCPGGRKVFFSSFLDTILQLGYGRNPGLDAVRFKAAVLYTPLKK